MKCFLSLAALVSLSSFGYGESEEFLQAESHIVGGGQAKTTREMVSLQVYKSDELANDYEWRHVCGGALVDKRWVLTAAQCAKEIHEWAGSRVVVGTVDLRKSRGEHFFKVRRVVLHPEWKKAGDARDIALLELEKDVRQTSDVVPAPVKKRSQGPINEYNLCHTKGWGRTGESADFSSTLKTVYLKLLTNSQCRRAYRDAIRVRIFDENVCAGLMGQRDQGICQGDLGAPLFCDAKIGGGLVAIATNGATCGSPRHPGIFLKVDRFLEWIHKTTNNKQIGA